MFKNQTEGLKRDSYTQKGQMHYAFQLRSDANLFSEKKEKSGKFFKLYFRWMKLLAKEKENFKGGLRWKFWKPID